AHAPTRGRIWSHVHHDGLAEKYVLFGGWRSLYRKSDKSSFDRERAWTPVISPSDVCSSCWWAFGACSWSSTLCERGKARSNGRCCASATALPPGTGCPSECMG